MRVLIVDDDIATVNVIEQKVDWQKLGITEVFTAYNIARAREIIGQRDVDIIISDIEMPQGTGIDLLSWYRKNNYEGEFLLLTCHESFDYASHAIKLQAS
ncbi:MAG: response regulator, partial [Pseudobutyrivibrio sp.]|nr:response regulator [Pseudobutyrivibrio sp.]